MVVGFARCRNLHLLTSTLLLKVPNGWLQRVPEAVRTKGVLKGVWDRRLKL